MNAKSTRVALECEALGVREFEISQAETLLNMKPNGGWRLVDDNYTFTNGTIERANKGKSSEKPQKADN